MMVAMPAAQRTQLMAIAEEGWRLRVDTQVLCLTMYLRQPWELSEEQASEFLDMLAEEEGPETQPYDWATDGE